MNQMRSQGKRKLLARTMGAMADLPGPILPRLKSAPFCHSVAGEPQFLVKNGCRTVFEVLASVEPSNGWAV